MLDTIGLEIDLENRGMARSLNILAIHDIRDCDLDWELTSNNHLLANIA